MALRLQRIAASRGAANIIGGNALRSAARELTLLCGTEKSLGQMLKVRSKNYKLLSG
jgi:hypothetical protein